MSDATIAVGILSLIGIALSAYATYKATVKAKEIENEATPYSTLAERVTTLEKGHAQLLREQFVDREYMRKMIMFWPIGHPIPKPIPEWLEDHMAPNNID